MLPETERLTLTLDNGQVVVFVPYRLTLGAGSTILRETVQLLARSGFRDLTLDLAHCSYVDSSGIGELVSAYTLCTNLGGSLKLNGLRKGIRDLLQITKLYTVFDVLTQDYTSYPRLEISPSDLRPLQRAIELSRTPLPSMGLLLAMDRGRIQLLPAISQGIYKVATPPEPGIIIATPHIVANLTRCYLRQEIQEFEDLVNSPTCKELDIQRFLEQHPKFLLGQEYEKAYPQVILSGEGQPLIPDFILEPLDRGLCDVLDLKLPTERLIVGPDNRQRLSSAVSRGVAQLRSYRDYFEDREHRDIIRKRYGIVAYRPRLSLVIGRSPHVDPLARRRVEDDYRDVEIVTYDALLKRAKRFLLD